MKKFSATLIAIILLSVVSFKCNNDPSAGDPGKKDSVAAAPAQFGGFVSQVKYGEHLVNISGCNDCHTPKKMGPMGPEPDMSLALSGHPSQAPVPDVDRKGIESKGYAVTNDLTAWVGSWGVSYSANITADSTGIGNWKEDQFIYCLRHGKYMGLPQERNLLPPMPWQGLAQMTDDELKAVFAYLKSTKPVHNIVPLPQPPATMMKK
ncbi:MAG TPA: hypothetical protein VG847_10955 [Chitinophagaceae bacterium]|nr:hypothetical protein [Chitinophagaceae bacterium]